MRGNITVSCSLVETSHLVETSLGVHPPWAGGRGLSSRSELVIANVRVVGIADIIPERARDRADQFGIPRYFSTIDELLEDDFDVLHVLTPPDTHFELAMAGLQADRHVFVEKPFTTTVADSDQLLEEAKRRGRRICVDHSLLGDPAMRRAHQLIRRGTVGDVFSVQLFRCGRPPQRVPKRPPYPRPGDPMRETGIHALYCVSSILGTILDANVHKRSTGQQTDFTYDEWSVHLKCDRGFAQIHLTWNGPPHQVIDIRGDQGQLSVNLSSGFVLRVRNWPGPKHVQFALDPIVQSVSSTYQIARRILGFLMGRKASYRGLHDMTREFYRVLLAGDQMPITYPEVRNTVDWIEQIAGRVDDEALKTLQPSLDSSQPYPVSTVPLAEGLFAGTASTPL